MTTPTIAISLDHPTPPPDPGNGNGNGNGGGGGNDGNRVASRRRPSEARKFYFRSNSASYVETRHDILRFYLEFCGECHKAETDPTIETFAPWLVEKVESLAVSESESVE